MFRNQQNTPQGKEQMNGLMAPSFDDIINDFSIVLRLNYVLFLVF